MRRMSTATGSSPGAAASSAADDDDGFTPRRRFAEVLMRRDEQGRWVAAAPDLEADVDDRDGRACADAERGHRYFALQGSDQAGEQMHSSLHLKRGSCRRAVGTRVEHLEQTASAQ
jgi:hypothetical protein